MTFGSVFSTREARRQLAIGAPIFVAQLSQFGMSFTDTLMTARVGQEHVAAVAVAGSLWAPASVLPGGVLLVLPPMTAALVGSGRRPDTAHLMRQGLVLAGIMGIVFVAALALAADVLPLFGLDPVMTHLARGYLHAVQWGLPGYLCYVVLRSFLDGYGMTRPDMVVGLLGLALNIPCNFVLINGELGFPRLGAIGAGIATSLCYWFMAFAMWWYVSRSSRFTDLKPLFTPLLGLGGRSAADPPRLDWRCMGRILRIGTPNAFALFVEVSLFAVTALLLAPLGPAVVAGHQVAMNFACVVFMLPLMLGVTVSIRVGHHVGAGRMEEARRAGSTAQCLSVLCSLGIAAGIVLFREDIVGWYTREPDVTALALQLLLLSACYQMVDGLQTTTAGILRGYNDTRTILVACLVAYWGIGLTLGYGLARTDIFGAPMGAVGFWLAYILALVVIACAYGLRLRHLYGLDPGRLRLSVVR
ncbi:MAG: MATE family efflux transporter [Desulfovibrio sp.]|jgi:MATE family multidrug resistance protein|nr:MATE family efflux transporter [Desulfovibrio sp.]